MNTDYSNLPEDLAHKIVDLIDSIVRALEIGAEQHQTDPQLAIIFASEYLKEQTKTNKHE